MILLRLLKDNYQCKFLIICHHLQHLPQRNEQFCSFLRIPHVCIVASNKQSKNDFHILIWWDHQEKLFTFLLEKTTRFMHLRAVSNKTGYPKYDHPIWLMRDDFWGIPQTMAILSHPGSTQPLPENRNENLSLQVPCVSTPLPPLYAPRFCKIALTTVWSLVFFCCTVPCCTELWGQWPVLFTWVLRT